MLIMNLLMGYGQGDDVFSSEVDDEDLEDVKEGKKRKLKEVVGAEKQDICEEGGEEEIYWESGNPDSPCTSSINDENDEKKKRRKRNRKVKYPRYYMLRTTVDFSRFL